MKKPQQLQDCDIIAVISPSAGVPSLFPHVFDKGLENLKEMGFQIKEFPTARENIQTLKENPQMRANDINNAFKDKNVKGIITSIGGDDSIRILPYLDKQIIQNNPKFFMGFSDTAMINTYLNQLGLVTFNGPSIMAGFAQMSEFGKENFEKIKSFLLEKNYNYTPYSQYCTKYKDWREHTSEVEKLIPNTREWEWIQGNKTQQGELFGGCIEVLEMMKQTQYWPKDDFWNNKIVFFETSEEKPSPGHVKCILRNYGVQGIFNKISGILIGRPKDYTDEEKDELKAEIIDLMNTEFNIYDLPIIMNMDFGHTAPQFILPLGIKAEINPQEKTFKLIEDPFE